MTIQFSVLIGLALAARALTPPLWRSQAATFVHEIFHGGVALATRGQFCKFSVKPGGAGVAYTIGGNRASVLLAGYAGPIVVGALLLGVSLFCNDGGARWTLRLLSLGLALATARASDARTVVVGLLLSKASMTATLDAGFPMAPQLVGCCLGLILASQGVEDLLTLWKIIRAGGGAGSDAHGLASMLGTSTAIGAILISVASLAAGSAVLAAFVLA